MALMFLPEPHVCRAMSGRFHLPRQATIGIQDQTMYALAGYVGCLFPRHTVHIAVSSVPDTVALRYRPGLKPGGYRLAVSSKGIVLEGESLDALFSGARTLGQALRQADRQTLPALVITDWPDFKDRGVYYDLARGRVPTLASLLRMADQLAEYKINQLQLYIEHTFAFRRHPGIGKHASPLSAEDILRLDAHCRERQIELVPSLASFGHLSSVLRHPPYQSLAEDWGVGKYITRDTEKKKMLDNWILAQKYYGFTLSPANPKIYRFLDELFGEFLPLFSSQRFNVCCDETIDLGAGQSYALCRKLGVGRVYLNHLIALNRLCRKYGKRMMFWGDIIRHHPELIPKIPKDVTVLDWGYEFDHPFDRIRDFKKAGLKFYACPSTSSYVALFPRLPQATLNIAGFAKAARKHGGEGLLNTDWGDGGHYNFMELNWHGYLFGAEQGWNTSADPRTFTRRFCRLFLNAGDPALARAIDELGEISFLSFESYYQSIWKHVFFGCPGGPVFQIREGKATAWVRGQPRRRVVMALDAALGRATLTRLEAIRKCFAAHAGVRREDSEGIMPYWLFAADMMIHAARKLTVLGPGGRDAPSSRRRLKLELLALRKRFVRLWLARSRRSEIDITLKKYDEALRGL